MSSWFKILSIRAHNEWKWDLLIQELGGAGNVSTLTLLTSSANIIAQVNRTVFCPIYYVTLSSWKSSVPCTINLSWLKELYKHWKKNCAKFLSKGITPTIVSFFSQYNPPSEPNCILANIFCDFIIIIRAIYDQRVTYFPLEWNIEKAFQNSLQTMEQESFHIL